jgi:hypothetical protein
VTPPTKSPVQLTVMYINALQNHMDNEKHAKQNIMMYYMDRVKKDENKVVDLLFVEKLFNEGIDVDYVDDLEENALFKVHIFKLKRYCLII